MFLMQIAWFVEAASSNDKVDEGRVTFFLEPVKCYQLILSESDSQPPEVVAVWQKVTALHLYLLSSPRL